MWSDLSLHLQPQLPPFPLLSLNPKPQPQSLHGAGHFPLEAPCSGQKETQEEKIKVLSVTRLCLLGKGAEVGAWVPGRASRMTQLFLPHLLSSRAGSSMLPPLRCLRATSAALCLAAFLLGP